MFKLLIILIIMLDVLIRSNKSDETSSTDQQKNILPIVLIRIDKYNFIHPTRLVSATTDDNGNFLVRTQFVAEQRGVQLFFCGHEPIGSNSQMEIDGKDSNSDSRYFAYQLSEFGQGSKLLRCPYEPEPFVKKLLQKKNANEVEEISCKSLFIRKGVMFAFVYEIKTDDNVEYTFEIYRFCYNEEQNRVLFTEHVIASPRFLDPNNNLFRQERIQTYEMSDEPYGFFGTKYTMIKNAYQELKNQKEKPKPEEKSHTEVHGKSLITNKIPLRDQKLVPAEDMALAIWKKPTHHLLNTSAMKEEKIKLWDHINQLIREDAINQSREYHVYTGAFTLVDKGLDNKELLQPDDLWIKVVHYKRENNEVKHNESIAIVMNHNPDIEFVARSFDVICEENLCKNKFEKEFPTEGKSVCCVSSAVVDYYFNIEVNDHNLLKINSFINEKGEASQQ